MSRFPFSGALFDEGEPSQASIGLVWFRTKSAHADREDLPNQVKEWIVCEDNCLKCSYGATLDCDGDCPRCPRNTYCPCVTFVSFAAGKLAPVAQPVTATFDRPRKR